MYKQKKISNWNRRQHFQLFRTYDHPFFNMTANVDVRPLYDLTKRRGLSFFLASLFVATKAANQIENFRFRIRGEGVIEWEHVHLGSTVLLSDNTFGFCYFEYTEDLSLFCKEGEKQLQALQAKRELDPKSDADDLLHFSVIPWVSFTAFQHARRHDAKDSVPKIVFGKYFEQGDQLMMPVSVEVHHALADGYHVGQFFSLMQHYCAEPPNV